MSKPLFSILHSSARPDKWREVFEDWMSKAKHPENVEYVLCIDERWGFYPAAPKISGHGEFSRLRTCWNESRRCYVDGVNAAARASSGSILIVNADDQFAEEGWDEKLCKAYPVDGIGDYLPFVIEVSTGTPQEHERGIMVMPILSRKRYEDQGSVVFYPEYESMFADNDFCEWAKRDGMIIDARHLMFPHRHWLNGGREKDAADLAQGRREAWELGNALFARRNREGFGPFQSTKGESAGVPKQEDGPNTTIAIVRPGEMFWGRVFDNALEIQGYLLLNGWDVIPMREYTGNVYVTRENLRQAIQSLEVKPDLILWLDDDNILSTAHLEMLFSDLSAHPEVDGVMGWCWIHPPEKTHFQVSCGNFAPDGKHWKPFPNSFFRETEPRPAEVGGFPCVLMRKSALDKAGDQPFIRGVVDPSLAHGIGGEDLAFFRAAMQGGAKFLADPRVRVPHLRNGVEVEPTFIEEGLPEVNIAVMMRVKNEARWIGRVIDSVKDLGPVFVMDDGSTDATREIAASYGAFVFGSPFTGQSLDERRDKNWLLNESCEYFRHAIGGAGASIDYMLCIDGDEELQKGGVEIIRRACQKGIAEVYANRFLFLWDRPDQARFDGRYGNLSRYSLFKVRPGQTFVSHYKDAGDAVNQGLHTGNAPIDTERPVVGSALNVFFLHYGYMLAEDRARKFAWYNQIDPNNELEDCYRHMIQGDPGGPGANERLKHGGPMDLRKLPASIAPDWGKLEWADILPTRQPDRRECSILEGSRKWLPLRLSLNLGCSDRLEPGFVNVDIQQPCDLEVDLTKRWPWEDSAVDYIRAHDIIEHLPDKVFTMNEAYRVLKPGARFEIVVPTTDGRGAYQDPTHVSFWNRNSFFYFEHQNPHLTRFRKGNGVNCAFQVVDEYERDVGDGVVKLFITLQAVKPSMAMAAD